MPLGWKHFGGREGVWLLMGEVQGQKHWWDFAGALEADANLVSSSGNSGMGYGQGMVFVRDSCVCWNREFYMLHLFPWTPCWSRLPNAGMVKCHHSHSWPQQCLGREIPWKTASVSLNFNFVLLYLFLLTSALFPLTRDQCLSFWGHMRVTLQLSPAFCRSLGSLRSDTGGKAVWLQWRGDVLCDVSCDKQETNNDLERI